MIKTTISDGKVYLESHLPASNVLLNNIQRYEKEVHNLKNDLHVTLIVNGEGTIIKRLANDVDVIEDARNLKNDHMRLIEEIETLCIEDKEESAEEVKDITVEDAYETVTKLHHELAGKGIGMCSLVVKTSDDGEINAAYTGYLPVKAFIGLLIHLDYESE